MKGPAPMNVGLAVSVFFIMLAGIGIAWLLILMTVVIATTQPDGTRKVSPEIASRSATRSIRPQANKPLLEPWGFYDANDAVVRPMAVDPDCGDRGWDQGD